MFCDSTYGPNFGNDDIDIRDNSNTKNDNNSILNTYQQPLNTGIAANEYLAGAEKFKVTEMEVFRIL